jgi:hypothetical protein
MVCEVKYLGVFVNVYHIQVSNGYERGRAIRATEVQPQVLYSTDGVFNTEKRWCEKETLKTGKSTRFIVRVESSPGQDYEWRPE